MDSQTLVNVISTVGFPIACCLIMFWFAYTMMQTHKEETEKLTEALNNNTLALTEIKAYISANEARKYESNDRE